MFQFTGFASLPYVFRSGYSLLSGFPHSDIGGSKLHCQLPPAFRRLARPSSPVIAKASTTCTLSLDPITLHSVTRDNAIDELAFVRIRTVLVQSQPDTNAITQPMSPLSHQQRRHTSSTMLKIEQS